MLSAIRLQAYKYKTKIKIIYIWNLCNKSLDSAKFTKKLKLSKIEMQKLLKEIKKETKNFNTKYAKRNESGRTMKLIIN